METLHLDELSVLLVEPSHTQARIIQEHLTQAGITDIDLCLDAEQALNHMLENTPSLVMCSMYLPDSTASDLILKMRQTPDLQDTPFILVSSETTYRYLTPLKQAGVTAILRKPFYQEDLIKCLISTQALLEENEEEPKCFESDFLKCLLVDDSRTSRRHITHLLNKAGIENIIEAENGREAIELLRENTIDFIISDYNMPEMNGRELVEYLQHSELSYIPILMITSEADGPKLNAVRLSGVYAILDKTIDVTNLRQTLEHCMHGH